MSIHLARPGGPGLWGQRRRRRAAAAGGARINLIRDRFLINFSGCSFVASRQTATDGDTAMPQEIDYIDDGEAAKACKISKKTWSRMDARGELPPAIWLTARKKGRRRSAINDMIARREKQATAA
jgi:predicted DNA-binding transcriptional regulator AlpA